MREEESEAVCSECLRAGVDIYLCRVPVSTHSLVVQEERIR